MSKGLMITGIVLLVLVLIGGSIYGAFKSTYNGMVQTDQIVQAKWGQVENQMQRRGDLIPQLVEVVKGFGFQEQSVIDSVTNARAALAGARTPADKDAANRNVTLALSNLLGYTEAYPTLKSDKHFTDLMREISGSENRIAVARGDYNTAVQDYNMKVRSFPANIFAPMMGFFPKEQFKADEASKAVPKIDMSGMSNKPAAPKK